MNKSIINGIDVSECCCFENNRCLWSKRYYENNNVAPLCEAVKNCYFKQLKRLQQQIEAYKLSENEAKEIIAELKHKNKGLKKELKILQQQIRLENQQYNDLVHDSVGDLGLIRKYKQALENIREYCEKCKKCVEIGDEVILYTVIKKVNEVLNDRD